VEPRIERFAAGLGLAEDVVAAWTAAWCGLSLAWSAGAPTWHDRAARAVATRLLPRLP
jgi:streptomycin 6-kinase